MILIGNIVSYQQYDWILMILIGNIVSYVINFTIVYFSEKYVLQLRRMIYRRKSGEELQNTISTGKYILQSVFIHTEYNLL